MNGSSENPRENPGRYGPVERSLAVVIGGGGGIGGAMVEQLRVSNRYAEVRSLSRTSVPALDITSETSVQQAAETLLACGLDPRLVFVATGFLHAPAMPPEKSLRDLDAASMAHAFAVNTIGPALLIKHLLPLLPRHGKSVFAVLSARVGSIGDNQIGGWYSYRASKAALNQLVRTAAIELKRRRPDAICVALHPGTVATRLSDPFGKAGLDVQTADVAAQRLLSVIDALSSAESGNFFDHHGKAVPW
jgi:NAD(P)-dependent dehydrogenase (short-subunit alcohol dehydrogenase family)